MYPNNTVRRKERKESIGIARLMKNDDDIRRR
jgi:hypothetical protein